MRQVVLSAALFVTTIATASLASTPLSAQAPATRSAPGAALDDPTVVAIFDAANTADIETGDLAAERGSSKAVRDFGAMIARDHRNVRGQGRDLAKKLGVTPTAPKNDHGAREHAEAMRKLRALHGAAFDRAFLEHEVAFHQAVIDAVNSTLLPAIQNPQLKQLVVTVAPAFAAHRDAAKRLLETEAH